MHGILCTFGAACFRWAKMGLYYTSSVVLRSTISQRDWRGDMILQRDHIQHVIEFLAAAFQICKMMFFNSSSQFETIDDELMVTKWKETPLKMIRSRKAVRKGQSFDVVSDALFLFYLDARLHQRGESKLESVKNYSMGCVRDTVNSLSAISSLRLIEDPGDLYLLMLYMNGSSVAFLSCQII